jgi:hypothetical protein
MMAESMAKAEQSLVLDIQPNKAAATGQNPASTPGITGKRQAARSCGNSHRPATAGKWLNYLRVTDQGPGIPESFILMYLQHSAGRPTHTPPAAAWVGRGIGHCPCSWRECHMP